LRKDLAVPDNISLLFLPPYSPGLNPNEKPWDEIREKLLQELCPQVHLAVRRKLEQAILYIERNPETAIHHLIPLHRQVTLMWKWV
jgi:transposase